jgi:hypothetical protein
MSMQIDVQTIDSERTANIHVHNVSLARAIGVCDCVSVILASPGHSATEQQRSDDIESSKHNAVNCVIKEIRLHVIWK